MKTFILILLCLGLCGVVEAGERYNPENHSLDYNSLAWCLMCEPPICYSEKNVAEIILLHSEDDEALKEEAENTLIEIMGSTGEEVKMPNGWRQSRRRYKDTQ